MPVVEVPYSSGPQINKDSGAPGCVLCVAKHVAPLGSVQNGGYEPVDFALSKEVDSCKEQL